VRNGSQTGKDEITVPETGVVVVGGEVLQAKKKIDFAIRASCIYLTGNL
jgi:hypothetical protein